MESEHEGVLESALIDQRMRADRHKSNFDALKTQHLTLQEKFQSLRVEHDMLSENYGKLYEKSKEIIVKIQDERDGKIIECEELKNHAMTGLKLEQLRLQLAEEIEGPLRKRTSEAEDELELMRSEYNKLNYNYAYLKSEHDAALISHKSILEEMSAKHEIEISGVMEERKKLLNRQERNVPSDMQRIRQLERENNQLQQKVKSLIAENEEVQAEKEMAAEHSQQSQQAQSRQLVELQALNKTLELERSSLATQTQSLQTELSKSYQQHHSLSEQLNQAQRQLANTTRKLEETEHRHTMLISEMEMKYTEHCRVLEHEKESCVADNVIRHAQLETLTRTLQEHDTLLADKEQQIEQRVQEAREKEWEKQVVLEREKVEMEEKLAESQRLQSSAVEEYKLKVDKLETVVRQGQTEKSELESVLELVRSQLQDKSEQLKNLLDEVQQLSKLSKKYQTLRAEYRVLQNSELKSQEVEKELEDTVRYLEEDLLKTRKDMAQAQESQKQNVEVERQSWVQEKAVLHSRIEECQSQQVAISQKLAASKKEAKRLQRHYKKQLHEMKQAADLLEAHTDKLNTEKDTAIATLATENRKLKGKLAEMQRKRKEFMFYLQHNPHISLNEVFPFNQAAEVRLKRHRSDEGLSQQQEWAKDLEAQHDLQLLQLSTPGGARPPLSTSSTEIIN